MVAFGGDVKSDPQKRANGFKNTLKGAAVVNNGQSTEVDLEKNFLLHEKESKIVGCNVRGGSDDDKAS
jgi:hypothetical protein